MSPPPSKLHPLHRAWRLLPTHRRRALFGHATALLAPHISRRPPPARHGLGVGGELTTPSGLGSSARRMRVALDQLGVPNWGLDTGDRLPGHDPDRVVEKLPDAAPLVMHVNAPLMAWGLLQLPRRVARGRRVIGYWAWELPVVPKSWRQGLRFVHEIWVPSRFTADAIAGILPDDGTIILRIVPIPVAAAPPCPSALRRGDFGLPDAALLVLCTFNLASSFVRKNPLAAIAAHRAAFGDRADRILLMKVGHTEHYPQDWATIRAAAAGAPNIRFETRSLPASDNDALTACADIVLSLHRSEGFGLVPAEAMWLGRPVVATGWSGNTDFMNAENAALVGYRLVPAADPRGVLEVAGAVWADPDIGEAAAQLRRLADDPAERQALGARAAASVRQTLGAAPLAEAVRMLGLPVPQASS
jgi:glycosyltransferase involved in cell wall biosynthesis